jgi:hypothetical protein
LGPVKSIAVGYDESCAVSMSGQLYCWGRNNHGQLGNGTEVDTVTPVAVSPLPRDRIAHSPPGHPSRRFFEASLAASANSNSGSTPSYGFRAAR